jgi:hypothetical protein
LPSRLFPNLQTVRSSSSTLRAGVSCVVLGLATVAAGSCSLSPSLVVVDVVAATVLLFAKAYHVRGEIQLSSPTYRFTGTHYATRDMLR